MQCVPCLQGRHIDCVQAFYDADDQMRPCVCDCHGPRDPLPPGWVRPGDQPPPVKNDYPAIQDLVKIDVETRKQLGISRYGGPLQPHNGRDVLRDIYEEQLDAAMYLRQLLYERDGH